MTPISIMAEEVYNNVLGKIASNEVSSSEEIFEQVLMEAVVKVKGESVVSFDSLKDLVAGINGEGLFSALASSTNT